MKASNADSVDGARHARISRKVARTTERASATATQPTTSSVTDIAMLTQTRPNGRSTTTSPTPGPRLTTVIQLS